jgi:hypothetical protein
MIRLLPGLLILTVLLLVTHAHAAGLKEPVYPPYCWVQPTGQDLWYTCDSEEAKDKACLNLMESAMKAREQEPITEQTQKLWDRAKNFCWSDLKDKQPQHYH